MHFQSLNGLIVLSFMKWYALASTLSVIYFMELSVIIPLLLICILGPAIEITKSYYLYISELIHIANASGEDLSCLLIEI